MSRLGGARLIVPLPFALDTYRTDFIPSHDAAADTGRPNSLRAFHDLLDAADQVFELPLLGPDSDSETGRQRQFSALGAWLLQHCDHLVLVWDGAPAAGPGGTGGDVAAWAQQKAIPKDYRASGTGGDVRAKLHIVPFERKRVDPAASCDKGREP